ncbi:uncharacterized protein SCHCODRAFT_02666280 [Schizophyllum commune H4-8]|uniref:uncharacterized protein n=1 Tax=Schizophyllum commune (strain H4-8 / FGSC 9210) TaxID=578458 RepID=UPI002160F1B0|nr:uncharacterized protein SCHCODRAFT_02666280 [Schizophyllum commune H4-8]KAI5893130.1 hypothetical protein SCHCODRAFT_02666280 [Schizophyllum commune H4-8]
MLPSSLLIVFIDCIEHPRVVTLSIVAWDALAMNVYLSMLLTVTLWIPRSMGNEEGGAWPDEGFLLETVEVQDLENVGAFERYDRPGRDPPDFAAATSKSWFAHDGSMYSRVDLHLPVIFRHVGALKRRTELPLKVDPHALCAISPSLYCRRVPPKPSPQTTALLANLVTADFDLHGATEAAIMVKQGAYNGRVPRGSHQLAQEITRMFEAYIGVHCNMFGLGRSQTLVKDIYHLPMVAACEAVKVWEATTSVSLRGGFNFGAGSEHVPQPDATRAALSALYTTTLPDGCPELAQEFASTPGAHRPGRMALGMDALHAMTVLAITSFWEDIAPPQLWRIVSVILSQEFLHHIPHRLNSQLVRWPNKNDHLQVFFWFGCQALAGHEQAMQSFVYELIRPAILALRAFYFPLYLPNARIPFDWSNRIIFVTADWLPAMRYMLLRYVEGRSLGLYAGLMPDLRVKTVVEDAQRLLGTETQYITYDDTMGQIAGEWPVNRWICNHTTRPNTANIEAVIEQFLCLNFPRNLQSTILRFGTVKGELDGSVIMCIRDDCVYSIFEGNMMAESRIRIIEACPEYLTVTGKHRERGSQSLPLRERLSSHSSRELVSQGADSMAPRLKLKSTSATSTRQSYRIISMPGTSTGPPTHPNPLLQPTKTASTLKPSTRSRKGKGTPRILKNTPPLVPGESAKYRLEQARFQMWSSHPFVAAFCGFAARCAACRERIKGDSRSRQWSNTNILRHFGSCKARKAIEAVEMAYPPPMEVEAPLEVNDEGVRYEVYPGGAPPPGTSLGQKGKRKREGPPEVEVEELDLRQPTKQMTSNKRRLISTAEASPLRVPPRKVVPLRKTAPSRKTAPPRSPIPGRLGQFESEDGFDERYSYSVPITIQQRLSKERSTAGPSSADDLPSS